MPPATVIVIFEMSSSLWNCIYMSMGCVIYWSVSVISWLSVSLVTSGDTCIITSQLKQSVTTLTDLLCLMTWLEQRIDSNKTIITIILSHLGTMYYLLLSLHTIIIRGQMVIIDTYTTCQAWIIPMYIVNIGSCFLFSAQNEIFKNYDQLQLQLFYN